MAVNFFALSFKSICLGCFVGLLCSFILKHVNMAADPVKETTMMIMFAYLSYLLGEGLHFSGIITMFISGLCMAHYAYWNISKKARIGTELAITTISNICQCFIYVYMGLSSFSIEAEFVKQDMVMVTLASIFICRIFSVGIPVFLVYVTNGFVPSKLKWNEWAFVYFGGLIRGAIAFGLSLQMTTDSSRVLKTTTQICALITTIGIGSPIQLLAKCFGIRTDQEVALDAGGDDGFLKADGAAVADGTSSRAGSCQDEGEVIGKIDAEFQELIDDPDFEFPWLIGKWLEFDSKVMLPLFKRKTVLKCDQEMME